jgi:UDP-N-acetyl-D-mannosaminuronic acid transferase (WecB/TagA/CpsF family)
MSRQEIFQAVMSAADIIHADGQATVFASHLTNRPIPERSATTDFIHDASRLAARA